MKTATVSLGSVANIIMGTSPKGNTYNNVGNGLPLINGPTEFGADHPSCTLFTTKSSKECETGDLIFCVRGSTTGRMNWADKKYSLGRGVCSIRGKTPSDTIYIRYSLEQYLNQLLQFACGATFPNLTKDTIHSFKIPYPFDRERIVNIVQNYDMLINNNRKRIQLLEESARLLFRERFVYFRFPLRLRSGQAGHEKVHPIRKSNSNGVKIVDGAPEGWKRGKVKDLGVIVTGKTPSTKNVSNFNGAIPFIKTPDMHKSPIIINTEESLSETGANSQKNKYLPPRSILVSCIGTVGIVAMNWLRAQTNQQINSIIPKKEIYRYYSFFYLSRLKPLLEAIGGGSTMANINKNKFEGLDVFIPPGTILESFDRIVDPVFNQIAFLLQQNQKLAQARDLLLPRLMSGAIEV